MLPTKTARNIGAMFDNHMKMNDQINSILKSCYHHNRSISKIKKYLTRNTLEKMIHAFVSSRLDNLNSLLINIPEYQIRRLQLIQNHAARLILHQGRSCHASPLLYELHWIPVKYRIHYKILLVVYKCIHGIAPQYLVGLLRRYKPLEKLRSSRQLLLEEMRPKREYGRRAFASVGPQLWNQLPEDLRNSVSLQIFKAKLKTFLFSKANLHLPA